MLCYNISFSKRTLARFCRAEARRWVQRREQEGARSGPVTRDCAVMMVDDVHKMHVFETIDRMLTDPESYEKHYFTYRPHPAVTNALCICLRRDAPVARRMPMILGWLGVELERDYRPADA